MRRSLVVSIVALLAMTSLAWTDQALARAGHGGWGSSRGPGSYSAPTRPLPAPIAVSHPSSPAVSREQAPSHGWSSLGGFIVGGLLGGLLFGSSRPGMGLLDLVGLGLLGLLALKLLRSRPHEPAAHDSPAPAPNTAGIPETPAPSTAVADAGDGGEPETGIDRDALARIATDVFVKVQAAWSARDLGPVAALLTQHIQSSFERDCTHLAAQGRVNKIESIQVELAEVVEVWQEDGQDNATVRFDVRLIDYTVDEKTGQLVDGSPATPVSFEEFWTFTRPVWAKGWRLSAIQQPVPAVN